MQKFKNDDVAARVKELKAMRTDDLLFLRKIATKKHNNWERMMINSILAKRHPEAEDWKNAT